MSVSKDFIKFRQYIRTQDLKVNEQYLLELIFEYHNTNYNYCFLTFEQIMHSFGTTSKNRISSTIKKLEAKELIRVDRQYSNNRYFILEIDRFINTNNKPKDSNGKPPLGGQVHFSELTEEESEVMNTTNLSQNQAKTLLQLSDNKVEKLISTIQYAIKKGANNVYGYVKALLIRNVNVDDSRENYTKKSIPFIDNCSSRNYSDEWYSEIENCLLGLT